jgi:hypothetical protein
MSPFNNVIDAYIAYLKQSDLTADEFGEMIRSIAFDTEEDQLGCYNCFNVRDNWKPGLTPDIVVDNLVNEEDTSSWRTEVIQRIDQFENPDYGLWIAWFWDSDGTLFVSDGQHVAINRDCKKTHGWEYLT